MNSKFQKSILLPNLPEQHYPIDQGILDSVQGKIVCLDSEQRNSLLTEIRTSNTDCVWINLDHDDHDPGRFWLKLVAGLRKFYPEIGKELLASLMDHHSQPLASSMKNLSQELGQENILIVYENIQFLTHQNWWKFFQDWLNQNFAKTWIGLETDQHSQETSNLEGHTNDPMISAQFEDLSKRLIDVQEWLEYIHILLNRKEFEQAGEILEELGETWLEDGFDPLEFLFWLREIPGVLLTARPVLCWLGAKTCHSLQLPFLVNYYSNAAEYSLNSLSRFSRNTDQWLGIEINDEGLTVGELLEKINLLKPQQ